VLNLNSGPEEDSDNFTGGASGGGSGKGSRGEPPSLTAGFLIGFDSILLFFTGVPNKGWRPVQVRTPFEKHFFGMLVYIGLPSFVVYNLNVSGSS
jgi:hypothetical protein